MFTARYGLGLYNSGYVFCVDLRTNIYCYIVPYNVRKRVTRAEVMTVCLSVWLSTWDPVSERNASGNFLSISTLEIFTADEHCRLCVPLTHNLVCTQSRVRNVFRRSPNPAEVFPTLHLNVHYRYAPHNDVSVNDGLHIRRWSHKIMTV